MEKSNSQGNKTLKHKAISRLLLDMIEGTRQANRKSPFFILILDDFTIKILSSYLKMSTVLNNGIFSVESLDKQRKDYPTYAAIYFISPSKKSCQQLVDDFKQSPKYGSVHIFFSSRILDSVMSILAEKQLAPRIQTLKEINLAFFSIGNLFDLRMKPGLEIFVCRSNHYNSQRRQIISTIKERLSTVFASMKEYPYIQYQSTSLFATELAQLLNADLSALSELKLLNPKRNSICLIVDRSYDPVTPLLHDYSYRAIVHDLFDVNEEGVLSIPSEKIDNYALDEADTLWSKYQYEHISEVFEGITNDLDEFKKSDQAKAQKSNLDTFDEMINALEGISGYRDKTKQFGTHLKICDKLMKVTLYYIDVPAAEPL